MAREIRMKLYAPGDWLSEKEIWLTAELKRSPDWFRADGMPDYLLDVVRQGFVKALDLGFAKGVSETAKKLTEAMKEDNTDGEQ